MALGGRCRAIVRAGWRCSQPAVTLDVCAQHHMHGYIVLFDDATLDLAPAPDAAQEARARRVRSEE